MSKTDKEVWRNVAGGVRWVIVLDPIGNQRSTVVQPGKTFTISPIERQLNQMAVYDPKVDPFLDGTFLIVKESADTVAEEIESADSLDDTEISEAVAKAIKGDPVSVELMLERTDSLITTQRIYEELVSQDASQSLVVKAKSKVDYLTPKPVGTDGQPIQVGDRTSIVNIPPGPTSDKNKNWKVAVE